MEHAGIDERQLRDLPRHGQHHMIILHRQKLGGRVLRPLPPLGIAATRAVPVVAAVGQLHHGATIPTHPLVRAHQRCVTGGQFPQHPILLLGHRVSEAIPVLRGEGADRIAQRRRAWRLGLGIDAPARSSASSRACQATPLSSTSSRSSESHGAPPSNARRVPLAERAGGRSPPGRTLHGERSQCEAPRISAWVFR